jgi:phage shock protein PspC (stress-responsive transcriptional regulator)
VAKRLVRDTRHAVLGGVAAGFGKYLDVDPVLVRLAFVLLAFAHGAGLMAYLLCWLVVPREDAGAPRVAAGPPADQGPDAGSAAASEPLADVRAAAPAAAQGQAVVGSFLVVAGALLLAHNLGWLHWPHWLSLHTLWPLLVVALGAGLVAKSLRGN